MNYALLMKGLGLKWRDRDGKEIDDLFTFFKSKGVNRLRVRIWVGGSGPSRLPYALKLAEEAYMLDFKIQPTIFLSDCWADLYKQPEPKDWASLDFQSKLSKIQSYISSIVESLTPIMDNCAYFQVGNEIDYGICGVFAHDRKRRKNFEWLRKHVWKYESTILNESFKAIKTYYGKPVALHLGKWWDLGLISSFLSAMDEFKVEYDVLCFSFYPSMFGAGLNRLEELKGIAEDRGKLVAIAEYAYPSCPIKGQFWFMNKPSPDHPLTPEGQSLWLKDFLTCCKRLNLYAAFYWSPELYLTKNQVKGLYVSEEMPLDFGWGPMSFFDEDGYAKPCVESLSYGIVD
ncbi:glycosyl hydrolase 53 family protein [Candidatus Bathyarchaeota archaeon]|nr:glycosyl hydrolase 53 family protein [Candidatus Bathyarchaeota archaeon]MBS7617983.1 glycosyl hydrolase 53 family protein [Candidatus Bathyarchaeota archaeon]